MTIGLIGYRGSGKTTVGSKLAERLSKKFVDTDVLIVRRAGKTIKEIFEQSGEPAFRDIESQIVREVCLLDEAVIAFGGGALTSPENCKAFQKSGHKLVYLRCDPAVCLQRMLGDPNNEANRPGNKAIDDIKRILSQREPKWLEMNPAALDVTHLTADEVMENIVGML